MSLFDDELVFFATSFSCGAVTAARRRAGRRLAAQLRVEDRKTATGPVGVSDVSTAAAALGPRPVVDVDEAGLCAAVAASLQRRAEAFACSPDGNAAGRAQRNDSIAAAWVDAFLGPAFEDAATADVSDDPRCERNAVQPRAASMPRREPKLERGDAPLPVVSSPRGAVTKRSVRLADDMNIAHRCVRCVLFGPFLTGAAFRSRMGFTRPDACKLYEAVDWAAPTTEQALLARRPSPLLVLVHNALRAVLSGVCNDWGRWLAATSRRRVEEAFARLAMPPLLPLSSSFSSAASGASAGQGMLARTATTAL